MSKANWVNPEDIQLIQPATPEELITYRDDIILIHDGQMPADFMTWAVDYFPFWWIFYLDGEPVGVARRDFFKRSVQLHGWTRKEYMGRGIEHYAVLALLNHTFMLIPRTYDYGNNLAVLGYPKITVEVEDGNKYALGFAIKWGFEKTARRNGNATVWRLSRERYLQRFSHAIQKSPTGQSDIGDNAVSEHAAVNF